ncbi:MAG: alpha/beta hydrolase [Clostridiaceae bacterium]|nr:alpha/beta hydrolase [Clostridiaceae bacterium]
MELTVRGLKTNVYDTGGGTRGTVLFLHGWNAPIRGYTQIFDLLGSLGWRVVSFDMPGVGGTEEPEAPLTLEDYAAFALALCTQLGVQEAVLFGHSHGGRTALLLLEDEHCPLKCEKAILMGSAGVRRPPSPGKQLTLAGYKAAKFLGTNPVTKPLFGDLYEELRDKRSSTDYKAATPVMRRTLQNVVVRDLRPGMGKIKAETLLIWGDRDTAAPLEDGREMERLIPGAGLAIIQNAGHFCFVDNWPQFEAVVRAFL